MKQIIPVIQAEQRPGVSALLQALCAPARSLYIHVPFCFHKCHYCDFYSFVDSRGRDDAFVDALCLELAELAPLAGEKPLQTVFIGGGTPTLLPVSCWRRLLSALAETFDLSEIRSGGGEFTVECNPETLTEELASALVGGGVNRMSIGAQTFSPAHLKALERWHDPESVPRALDIARRAGIARRSLDLIYAVPGQTLGEWASDLDTALSIDPDLEHVSCYALTYEPNTAMTARLRRGDFAPCSDDLEADMHEHTVERLDSAGFTRYEVSNFARPGGACAHNMAYWRQASWLAAGPSASAHVRVGAIDGRDLAPPLRALGVGWRWKNVPNLSAWMEDVGQCAQAPAVDVEPPDPRRAARERVMTGLRLAEGLDARAILGAAEALAARDRLAGAARREIETGRLEEAGDRWRLTRGGFLHADGVAAGLMRALE